MVASLMPALHAHQGPYQHAHDADGDDPVHKTHDTTQHDGVVGQRRIHTFVRIQVDQDSDYQENDEIA